MTKISTRRHFVAWSVAASLYGTTAAHAQSQAQTWMEYKPDGGRYRVEMPAVPKVATVPMPTGGGASVPMTEATAALGRTTYVASFVDFPNSVTKGAASERILDHVRNSSASSAGNSWRDETKLQLGRSEGREYTVVQANGNTAVTRIYWVRGRLYQLVVDGRGITPATPEVRRFLDSFAVI